MEIQNNPAFLLFIEPETKVTAPVIDKYTRKMAGAFRNASAGTSGYRIQKAHFLLASQFGYKGCHSCSCGHAGSSNQDYLIQTKDSRASVKLFSDNSFFSGDESKTATAQAVITNSLCVHYLACHRDDVSEDVLQHILFLEGEEVEPTPEELHLPKDSSLSKKEILR